MDISGKWQVKAGTESRLYIICVGEVHLRRMAAQYECHFYLSHRIEADALIVTESSGRNRTILGYPTADISEAARRLT